MDSPPPIFFCSFHLSFQFLIYNMGVLELFDTITVINGYINKMQACLSFM